MAAAGVPMRTLQEWLGHRDFKTVLIYADYAPSAHEGEMVERAFGGAGHNSGHKLSETENNQEHLNRPNTRNPNHPHHLTKVEGLVGRKPRGSSSLPGRT